MEVSRLLTGDPFFSVCIPQYNRTSFLLETCRSLARQDFADFEVCISDDCSTDGREAELLERLQSLGLSFVYRRREENGRYDANLRSAIGLSSGRYCFLLGNDDALASPSTFRQLRDDLQRFGPTGVVITNHADYATGAAVRRVHRTGVVGRGPLVAAQNYRNFSFVSGVVLEGTKARALATPKWDGTEMYQMYLGCRIIAGGEPLVGIDRVTVRKDIQLPGEQVDSYARKPRLDPCPIVERRLNLESFGRLVMDAVDPYVRPADRERCLTSVVVQMLLFTYPYWILEYRRVQSWPYAVGVCLGMRPRNVLAGLRLSPLRRALVGALYAAVSAGGLLVPIGLFDRIRAPLYALAKRGGPWPAGRAWRRSATG
jgi:glycosyltransferase involved in cell wall biosynthesis